MESFSKHFGPDENQLHGYPGHPELELAVMRLYALTQDPRHHEFAKYLLSARGVKREDQGGKSYFLHEGDVREDITHGSNIDSLDDAGMR